MGVRHSKEKTKHSKKFSSKRSRMKRASPDGEASGSRTECPDDCHSLSKDNYKVSTSHDFSASKKSFSNLRVKLPTENSFRSENSSRNEAEQHSPNWTLTFETNNEKLSHLMSSLRPHIESVHLDNHVGECRNIRVRLADSLDVDSLSEVDRSTESRQMSRDKIFENSNEETPTTSNTDRLKYYQEIPGREKPCSSKNIDLDFSSDSRKHIKNESLENQSRSCDRSCRNCDQRHSRSCHVSAKSSRFHSPFDQRSFQQAMLLRLTELQEKNASYARCLQSTLESSESEVENDEKTDSEYSGDDDNRVLGDSPQRNCARLFEPLPARNIESKRRLSVEHCSETNVLKTYVTEQHYHVSTSIDQATLPPTKPWNKSVNHHQNGRKKTFSKKRSSGSKRHHGYLKASAAIQTGEVTFPNTPKASSNLVLSSSGEVQRHEHEHIHHHYYYNCKTET